MPGPIVLPYFTPPGHARLTATLAVLEDRAAPPHMRLRAWAELHGLSCRLAGPADHVVVEYTPGLRAPHVLWLLFTTGPRSGELRLNDRLVVPIDELPRYSIGARIPVMSDEDREDMEFRDRHEGHVHD